MKRNDLVGGIFFLAAGLLFSLYARTVDIGEWSEPGPGFLPFYAGVLMTGMSALLIIKTLLIRQEAVSEAFFPVHDSWKRVSMVVASLIGYNILLTKGGFILTTFLFIAFLVKCIFPQGWIRSLVTATLSTAAVWVVFIQLLQITFPRGILGF